MIPKLPKRKLLTLSSISFGGIFLCYVFYQQIHSAEKFKQEALEGSIPKVSVVNPEPPNPLETITLPGTIRAWYEAVIYAQVSGYVKMWYKDYGAEVKEGDVLARIRVPALDAEYAQAEADLDSQKAKYKLAAVTADRYLALRNSHAVSEQSISVAVADKNSEEAKMKSAEKNVDKFKARMNFKTIVSPFNGVVIQRNINVGDYVNQEGNIDDSKTPSNLFTVAEIHRMRLFVSVPGTFAYLLKPGLTAELTVQQFPNRKFVANFLTVAKGFDLNMRTVVAEFTIDNKDRSLWPGSYAQVTLTAAVKKDLLTIPSSSLVFDEKGTQVATVTDDNKIHFKPITINKIVDTIIEVRDGVDTSDRIVNNPSASLLEGDEVKVVEPRTGYADMNVTKKDNTKHAPVASK
ncbi:efflux RND transporter periplasmic adaptor subunit [Leptospira semungkisensis]|uniref:Efflux RND transporter periplasmic adaptor subunit n=1 Tax=Leptospira semungkisensis TaxID=2484985 RepID=A0A4R9FM71_9LEPT|nr:efflux RND transporter periplasmic adaptor subunit [Leptospira semungkisensis]TGJ99523.1 efflux RND transporter periplasmic adaptor subunit [Leptospira semungkisensis]